MTPLTTQGQDGIESSTSTRDPDTEDRKKMTLLTPQVSQILEDHQLDDSSASEESEHSEAISQKSNRSHRSNLSQKSNSQDSKDRKESPPLPSHPRVQNLHATNSKKLAPPDPHEHLARFHSLRSMLFSSHIADNEPKWKAEHGDRSAKSPKPSTKERVLKRVDSGVRKLMRTPSKDLPTIQDSEEKDRSKKPEVQKEPEVQDYFTPKTKTAGTEEAEASPVISPVPSTEEPDFDNDGLRRSDVAELVRHVSRADGVGPPKEQKFVNAALGTDNSVEHLHKKKSSDGLSDPSTESDEEEFGNEEVDDLLKWVSRKPGEPQRLPSYGI